MKTTIFGNKLLSITSAGMKTPIWEKDGQPHRAYTVYIAQIKGLKTTTYTFYDSINNTNTETEPRTIAKPKELLYDILATLALDYTTELNEEITPPQGLNVTELEQWSHEVVRITRELKALFTEEEIEQLSEHDDNLETFISGLTIRIK